MCKCWSEQEAACLSSEYDVGCKRFGEYAKPFDDLGEYRGIGEQWEEIAEQNPRYGKIGNLFDALP